MVEIIAEYEIINPRLGRVAYTLFYRLSGEWFKVVTRIYADRIDIDSCRVDEIVFRRNLEQYETSDLARRVR